MMPFTAARTSDGPTPISSSAARTPLIAATRSRGSAIRTAQRARGSIGIATAIRMPISVKKESSSGPASISRFGAPSAATPRRMISGTIPDAMTAPATPT